MKFGYLLAATVAAATVVLFAAIASQNVLFADAQSYIFYCGNTSRTCKEVKVTTNPTVYKCFLQNINGEAAVYGTDFDYTAYLAAHNATILFEEQLSDSLNLYCSADLPYAITLYDKEVNLHICVKEDSIILASPIIFGGY
jgi:hypothetical protein